MKVSSSIVLAIFATCASSSDASDGEIPNTNFLGEGVCVSTPTEPHDYARAVDQTLEGCDQLCRRYNDMGGLRGFHFAQEGNTCHCHYDDHTSPGDYLESCPDEFAECNTSLIGNGPLRADVHPDPNPTCYEYNPFPVGVGSNNLTSGPTSAPTANAFGQDPTAPDGAEFVGTGFCWADISTYEFHDFMDTYDPTGTNAELCSSNCKEYPQGLRGFTHGLTTCRCYYENEYAPGGSLSSASCPMDRFCYHEATGEGPIEDAGGGNYNCYRFLSFPVTEAIGDPHCKQFHSQLCLFYCIPFDVTFIVFTILLL